MGRVSNCLSTMEMLFGFMILIVLVLLCMEPNNVEAQEEPPYPPHYELQALREIAAELGKKDWNFSENPCNNKSSWFTPPPPPHVSRGIYNSTVTCNCSFPDGECHIDGIYLAGQDLDGVLPHSLVNLSYIKTLILHYNYLHGAIPHEWGALKVEIMTVSMNRLSGSIPGSLGNISTLKYLSLENNMLSGTIPTEFGKLVNLENLTLNANYLTGNLPPSLAKLFNLKELISSNNFTGKMPNIFQSWKQLEKLEIQASGFEGPIPSSLAVLHNLVELDLSFNKLEGNISDSESLAKFQYINLFESFSGGKDLGLDNCLKNFPCSKDWYSVNINCGGGATTINGVDYEADEDSGGAAKFFPLKETWETSSTGLFWDTSVTSRDFIAQNVSILRTNNSMLYTRARLSPLSLTYYFRCLANGSYTVTLHFAEIVIRDNRSYRSLGRRIFDVYIQEKLELKDFNIKNEAKGVDKVVVKQFKTVVRNKTLTVRFHWAGKGTCATPRRGTYGPLISAIAVDSAIMELSTRLTTSECPKESQLLDWPTRQKICLGIAKGLAFLHEESSLKIVHRDIKTTNVLLDSDLNPKISDFGLAKFDEEENTHISTRVAGTIGYMAPEYALWGYLTYKADVYSFGIVALEIVAGKNNTKYGLEEDFVCLQDRALVLQQKGHVMELVDPRLGTEFNEGEAIRMTRVALLCTNSSPTLRPTMSEVVNMLEGRTIFPELVMDPSIFADESRFGALRDQFNHMLTKTSDSSSRTWPDSSSTLV
ncbi:hypothetical protein V6N13_075997 [Hibiscus sabdariffa]